MSSPGPPERDSKENLQSRIDNKEVQRQTDLEDFIPTIPFIRHEARSIVIALKMFEDSLDKTKKIDGNYLYKVIAKSIKDRALEIVVWAAALESERISDYTPPEKFGDGKLLK